MQNLDFVGPLTRLYILKVDQDALFRARMGRGAIAWITFLMEKRKRQIRYLCQQHLVRNHHVCMTCMALEAWILDFRFNAVI